jgi:methyl halide transferase
MEDLQCCITSCEEPLDQNYWDSQYKSNTIGWDLGNASPPIREFFDQYENKNAKILIPGCGNAYEAKYLSDIGFTDITLIDIAPTLVDNLKSEFQNFSNIKIILGDLFEHRGSYDLIIEQTFFCALPPYMRPKYVAKMYHLLAVNGRLIGLLFDRTFENSPPFGGSKSEYLQLFSNTFLINHFEITPNSIEPRLNTELWIDITKNIKINVSLYSFEGITCSSCRISIQEKFQTISGVKNIHFNTSNDEVLIVCDNEIDLKLLSDLISYDPKYKISKIL